MLQSDIPTHLITGIIVKHAEKVPPLVLEAFIVRLCREENKTGFLKAFTDQPEHITSGLSPLKNIMKELQLRKVYIYPRFQEDVKKSLERRRADVVELSQPLTKSMADIHHAIIRCMYTTLSELKRSNTVTLDLDDFNVDNANFRSFDLVLVNDLGTLRRLLYYLLTYDPLHFHAYLETLISSNSTSASGGTKQHQSPWLLTDTAHIIFQVAKRRCYTVDSATKVQLPAVIDLADDEAGWEALDGIENTASTNTTKGKEKETRPFWLPKGMVPVLEELPKWNLLAEILQEAEEEMLRQKALRKPITSGIVMSLNYNHSVDVLVRPDRIPIQHRSQCSQWIQWATYDAPEAQAISLMADEVGAAETGRKSHFALPVVGGRVGDGLEKLYGNGDNVSEALKKKDKEKAERAKSRRRVRGVAPAASAPSQRESSSKNDSHDSVMGAIQTEAESFAEFWESQGGGQSSGELPLELADDKISLDFESGASEIDFDAHYGLLAPEQTVLVRAYSDDTDDRMLAEICPKFIVMFEPNMEFSRRIEVYKSSNPGLAVRVYHMVYGSSCEEHKYLAGIRREKESFERLIKERGSMLLLLLEERRDGASDAVIKTISTRIGGG
ncbi:hypothetical protein D9615_010214 [Tricholomella constricta]|uniref:Uncharacterized protein n=1 Tax=Tricholomella constricta TaxID=117010 RepID=A0A8H5GN61_9AGAR|nr:hypothetical protein D9615_010214 [Tricholomella constricta]